MDLIKAGREIPRTATFLKIRALYESIIVKIKMSITIKEINAVEIPLVSALDLDLNKLNIVHKTAVCCTNSVFSSDNVSKLDIIGLIYLLGILVTYNIHNLMRVFTMYVM